MPMEIRLMGFEVVEKEVKRSGDSGRIYVPVTWVGTRVRAIRMQRLKHPPRHPPRHLKKKRRGLTEEANTTETTNTTEATEAAKGKTGSPLVA